jgi:hypothetical protein
MTSVVDSSFSVNGRAGIHSNVGENVRCLMTASDS